MKKWLIIGMLFIAFGTSVPTADAACGAGGALCSVGRALTAPFRALRAVRENRREARQARRANGRGLGRVFGGACSRGSCH